MDGCSPESFLAFEGTSRGSVERSAGGSVEGFAEGSVGGSKDLQLEVIIKKKTLSLFCFSFLSFGSGLILPA